VLEKLRSQRGSFRTDYRGSDSNVLRCKRRNKVFELMVDMSTIKLDFRARYHHSQKRFHCPSEVTCPYEILFWYFGENFNYINQLTLISFQNIILFIAVFIFSKRIC